MSEEGNRLSSASNVPDFRPELAFPQLTEEMVERLRSYGHEETFPANSRCSLLVSGRSICSSFSMGRSTISLPAADGETKVIAHHHRFDFSGELNLLNSQGSLVDARTVTREPDSSHTSQRSCRDSCARKATSRISSPKRPSGDASASSAKRPAELCSWGTPAMRRRHELQRFLIRNSYPHRIVEAPVEEAALLDDGLSDMNPRCRRWFSLMAAPCIGPRSRSLPTNSASPNFPIPR